MAAKLAAKIYQGKNVPAAIAALKTPFFVEDCDDTLCTWDGGIACLSAASLE